MELMQIRRQMMCYPDLPPVYRRVAWLEGQGAQYINTGIHGKSGLTAKYKIAFTRTDAVQQVCASAPSATNTRIYFPYNSGNAVWSILYDSSGVINITGVTMNANVPYEVEATFEAGNQRIIIDGNVRYTGANESDFISTLPLWLFAANNPGGETVKRYAYAKIYTFSLLESPTGQLLANYIPCIRRSDNKPGMYDTVSKVFKTNAGSGEFAVPS